MGNISTFELQHMFETKLDDIYNYPTFLYYPYLDDLPFKINAWYNNINVIKGTYFNSYGAVRLKYDNIVPIIFGLISFQDNVYYFKFNIISKNSAISHSTFYKEVKSFKDAEFLYNASFYFLQKYINIPDIEEFEEFWNIFTPCYFEYTKSDEGIINA